MVFLEALSNAARFMHNVCKCDNYPKGGFDNYVDLLGWMCTHTDEEIAQLLRAAVVNNAINEFNLQLKKGQTNPEADTE